MNESKNLVKWKSKINSFTTSIFSHIGEHMGLPVDTSRMSEQELQFHYFKMHDADNNNKLDGCELVKSLIHWHGKEYELNNNLKSP